MHEEPLYFLQSRSSGTSFPIDPATRQFRYLPNLAGPLVLILRRLLEIRRRGRASTEDLGTSRVAVTLQFAE